MPKPHNPRILIIEDNATLRMLITATLASDGYTVIEAADGMSALTLAETETPDLAVLDLHLPDLSGLEVARLFHQRLPFLVLTMDAEAEQVKQCIELGALGYLLKPLEPDAFLRQIRVALQRGRETRNLRRALQETQNIAKALGLLMAYHGVSDEVARQNLLDCSMARKRRTAELAADIIAAFENVISSRKKRPRAGETSAAAIRFLELFK
jgi:AmiR/NasT family two-component response regulator